MEPIERATSFGTDVGAYELGRPEYDDDHVAWMLDGVDGPVLDLGAGSGKLSRAVARAGFAVIAVDPDAAMLARNDAAQTQVGSADAIPLPDHSVAAVTVGQAWHWFDPATAGPEIARVLRPAGRLGLIWNTRDTSDPFVAELAAIIGPSPAEQMVADDSVLDLPGFTAFERDQRQRMRMMTPAEIEAMVTSRSWYILAEPEQQAEVLAGVRNLIATHRHSRGRERFEYALHSTVYRADRLRASSH
jgi:SAM-dependent methyltransferase